MISEEKWKQLANKMRRLDIDEKNILEKFILGSGAGGQKINKTSSCVWIKHIPTEITVKCQESRSREANRYFARDRLCEKIIALLKKEKNEKQKIAEKIRLQKKRRSRKLKQKILDDKKHTSVRKKTRKKPLKE